MRKVIGFITACLVAYIAAVFFYSQLNLANLPEMGVAVTMAMRWQTLQHDLVHMTTLYLPIFIVAFAIALPVATLLTRRFVYLLKVGYMLAGALALFCVDLGLQQIFGTHLLAVTRTTVGLLSQCLAGALGALAYANIAYGGSNQNNATAYFGSKPA